MNDNPAIDSEQRRNSRLQLLGSVSPYKVIIEPWAEESVVNPGDKCFIVAIHPDVTPTFAVEPFRDNILVYVWEGGSIFEFWRNGICEY